MQAINVHISFTSNIQLYKKDNIKQYNKMWTKLEHKNKYTNAPTVHGNLKVTTPLTFKFPRIDDALPKYVLILPTVILLDLFIVYYSNWSMRNNVHKNMHAT